MFRACKESLDFHYTKWVEEQGGHTQKITHVLTGIRALVLPANLPLFFNLSEKPGQYVPPTPRPCFEIAMREGLPWEGLQFILWGTKKLLPITAPRWIKSGYISFKAIQAPEVTS